jgi:RNA polymerase sigma factor (sigma-70 family)
MVLGDWIENTEIEPSGKNLAQMQAVLNRYCLSLTRSNWDAEDLAQDTWLKALRVLKGLGHTNPEAFLLRIAKNTWIDQLRRKTVLAGALKRDLPDLLKVTPSDNGNFEIEAAFQALMKHLSPLQRTVFLLRDVFGYSISEAAAVLGTSDGAVKSALHRARHALEAVKSDIEKGDLPVPAEEGLKAFLRSIAAAYRMGDITRILELVQRDDIDPAAAIAIAQNRVIQNSYAEQRRCANTFPIAKMAA